MIFLRQKEIFNNLYDKRIDEIRKVKNVFEKIGFDNLI